MCKYIPAHLYYTLVATERQRALQNATLGTSPPLGMSPVLCVCTTPHFRECSRVLRSGYSRSPPGSRWCAIESNMTALSGEAALFIPGYECHSSVAPGDFDRHISGNRLATSAIHHSRQTVLTALYRNSAVFRPPFRGGGATVALFGQKKTPTLEAPPLKHLHNILGIYTISILQHHK